MEKMECGCGGSRLRGLFPGTQAFPSSAEADGHMLTHCPSPRSGRERAPSPTLPPPPLSSAAPAQTSSQELFQAGTDRRDLAGKGVREGGAGETALGESECPQVQAKIRACKHYANKLRGTSLIRLVLTHLFLLVSRSPPPSSPRPSL